MSQQPELTPKQQQLMDFLNQLATTHLTPEMLVEGNVLLDAAASECSELQRSLETSPQEESR